jgi:hypothetical protein
MHIGESLKSANFKCGVNIVRTVLALLHGTVLGGAVLKIIVLSRLALS